MAPAKFIQVTAFRHQDITGAKLHTRGHTGWKFDYGNVVQVKISILNVPDTQVWPLNQRTFVLLAKGEAALNCSDTFEAHEFPSAGNLCHPGVAGWFQPDTLEDASCHRPLDDGFAKSVEGFELAALGGDRRVNRRATRIQIGGDTLLLRQRRKRNDEALKILVVNGWITDAFRGRLEVLPCAVRQE
jgi:hypothetical protein|nr:hypothetical protein [Candidatus Thiodictyon syntrophicum]